MTVWRTCEVQGSMPPRGLCRTSLWQDEPAWVACMLTLLFQLSAEAGYCSTLICSQLIAHQDHWKEAVLALHPQSALGFGRADQVRQWDLAPALFCSQAWHWPLSCQMLSALLAHTNLLSAGRSTCLASSTTRSRCAGTCCCPLRPTSARRGAGRPLPMELCHSTGKACRTW